MNINWDWSQDSEAYRILDTCKYISNGFFRINGFIPLQLTHDLKLLSQGVYLPLLSYKNISSFWRKVSHLENIRYPLTPRKKLHNQIKAFLPELSKPDTSTLELLTIEYLPKVSEFTNNLIPSVHIPKSIQIYPSYFGTVGSFNLPKDDETLVIFIRYDQGIKTIVECFLSAIIRPNAIKDLAAGWSESEFLVDWLIHSSTLNQILPEDENWSGTIFSTRDQLSQSLIKSSETFLQTIGAPNSQSQKFSIKDNQVVYNIKSIDSLTSRETVLLQKLIEKSPQPLTVDEIGSLIFSDEDKYSLSAINKAIERLRSKLDDLGISSTYIATASGIGYYLKN